MITTIIATLFAQRLQKESIYTLKLVRKGINIFAGKEVNILKSLKVTDVVKQSVVLTGEHDSFNTVLEKIVNSSHNYIYVTNENGKITGFISMHEIRQTLMTAPFVREPAEVMKSYPLMKYWRYSALFLKSRKRNKQGRNARLFYSRKRRTSLWRV